MTSENPVQAKDRDQELIRAALEGSEHAWKGLLTLYGDKIYGTALRFLANEKEAEDVTQEVWLQVIQKLPTFKGESRFGTWIYRVTMNKCLERLRKTKNDKMTRSIDELLPKYQDDGHYTQDFEDWSALVDQKVHQKMLGEYIKTALGELPLEFREAVMLRDVEALPGSEAAEILGIPEASLKTRLHRGRMALRALLEKKFGIKADQ